MATQSSKRMRAHLQNKDIVLGDVHVPQAGLPFTKALSHFSYGNSVRFLAISGSLRANSSNLEPLKAVDALAMFMVTYVLPLMTFDVREYNDGAGRSPYTAWFDRLNAQAAAKVATALTRLGGGNLSNVKGVGFSLFECRIDFGPGYRVYFAKDGERVVILLGGGSKKRQQRDVERALLNWQDYKRRKKLGEQLCP